jgi:hypothetical protein
LTREDEQDRRLPQRAHEELEHVARRGIGPVDVLEHEHERLVAPELLEQP